jgi:hypothetical protein
VVFADDDPECGSEQAATYFRVNFLDEGKLRIYEAILCCYRHVPKAGQVLPEGARLLELVIADAWTHTVWHDGVTDVRVNTDREAFDPAHPQAWAAKTGSDPIRL